MKKSLIALAALAATSAFAQSSVTLYGVADLNVQKVSGQAIQLANGVMANGGSRWGVRGTEDLGGGLRAGFNFEQGLSLENGAAAAGFARGAYVTLSSANLGELSLGRRLNPAFYTAATWELTGAANYSAVVSQFGTVVNGIRYNDMIMYTSPAFSGLTAQFGHVLKNDNAAKNAGGKATNDLSVRYAAGPLAVAANWNKDTNTNKHIGASYNFGVAKVAASLVDPTGASKGFTLGASAPVGPVTLTADLARDTEFKDTDFLLEAKYGLSKRTTAYAAFLNDGKKKVGALGGNAKGASVGVRHNF